MMKTPTEMNCAVFARVSTKGGHQDTENQLALLREFAAKLVWTIVQEYVHHVTGKHSDREQFQKHRMHLKRSSTWCRSGPWIGSAVDSCVFKDAVLAILAVIAKQERVRLSERAIVGLARARKQGLVGGRPKVVCDRVKVETLRAAGLSLTQIAAKVGASKSSVHRILLGS
jgi:DNA invertase Pin-like site-specific DNA recombinase